MTVQRRAVATFHINMKCKHFLRYQKTLNFIIVNWVKCFFSERFYSLYSFHIQINFIVLYIHIPCNNTDTDYIYKKVITTANGKPLSLNSCNKNNF